MAAIVGILNMLHSRFAFPTGLCIIPNQFTGQRLIKQIRG